MSDFWSQFGQGFSKPFVGIYNLGDKAFSASENIIDGVGSAAGALDDILSGKSNFLIYAGCALVAVIVLPKLIDRVV